MNKNESLLPIEWETGLFLKKITLELVSKHNKQPIWIINVSGGKDSMCLLHCFLRLKSFFLKKKFDSKKESLSSIIFPHSYSLQVLHCNHKTRPECEKEETLIQSICLKKGLPIHIFHYEKTESSQTQKTNFQESARVWRKQCVKELFDKNTNASNFFPVSVTAHHARDLTETILHRIIRGTGFKELGVMTPFEYKNELAGIARPWIEINYSLIEQYQKKRNVLFFEDGSNSEDKYTRNYIRKHILPHLENLNPQYQKNFVQLRNSILNHNVNKTNYSDQKNIISTENFFQIKSFAELIDFKKEYCKKSIHSLLQHLRNNGLIDSYTQGAIDNLLHEAKLCMLQNTKKKVQFSLKLVFVLHYNRFENSLEIEWDTPQTQG
jgi:tRNA(Ile)-lysidine synthase